MLDTTSRKAEEVAETKPQGTQALLGALTGIAGLLLAIQPQNQVAQAMSKAIPQLGVSLPAVIGALGTIVAAFSRPPRLRRSK